MAHGSTPPRRVLVPCPAASFTPERVPFLPLLGRQLLHRLRIADRREVRIRLPLFQHLLCDLARLIGRTAPGLQVCQEPSAGLLAPARPFGGATVRRVVPEPGPR